MIEQSQWLFEAPFTLETISEIHPYSALKFEAEWQPSGIDQAKEVLKVANTIGAGNQDVKQLTDLVFFSRHPELDPTKELNSKNIPNSQKLRQLKAEWAEIRQTTVRYAFEIQRQTDFSNKCLDIYDSCHSKCKLRKDPFFNCESYCSGVLHQCTEDIGRYRDYWSTPIPTPKKPTLSKQNKPTQKKPIAPPKKSTPTKQKQPRKGIIDIETDNLGYHNPELESEWELQDGSHFSYPLGEEEWEQASSCPDRNNLAIWISRFARYGNTIQSLPKNEQDRIGQIARHIISSYRSGCQPIRTIRLIGHADRDPQRGAAFEKKIGGDRAQVVQEALIRAINNPKVSQQITWQRTAEGASQLIVRNPKTESDRARNRRVEVILITSPSLQPSCAEECERDFQRCLQTPSTREQCLRRLRSCRSDCRGRPV